MLRKLACVCMLVTCTTSPGAAADKPYTKNVAIMIYPGVEILDFAGPSEVFAAAAGFGANGADRAFNCYTVSKVKAPLESQGFIDVTPDYSITECPHPDILVLPGGNSQVVTDDAEWMKWINTTATNADHVLTVCTGAFILGKAGLLDGLDATTWYNAVPALAQQFPKARVQPGRRFIDNGKIITTAGVSAGIDGSLHLVARMLGQYVAGRTAEYMEYKWSPESYLSAHYVQLNPRLDARGRALQRGAISIREGDHESAIASSRALVQADKNDTESWLQLGRALHLAKQYQDAIGANQEAAKAETPAIRGRALYNLACEYALTGDRAKALDAAEKAVAAGFKQKAAFETDTDLAAIRDDARFKRLLGTL